MEDKGYILEPDGTQVERKFYLCDFSKNVDCPKTICVSTGDYGDFCCRATTKIEYAKLDTNGKPIEIHKWSTHNAVHPPILETVFDA